MTARETVALFTRYPLAGRTKTRLIPALGAQGAADLQRRMAERVIAELWPNPRFHLEICYTGGTLSEMKTWLGEQLSYRRQIDGDLGQRMASVLNYHHARGRPVCLIGTDCPALSGAILAEAFAGLEHHDLVIGPSHDGGYYLIGCSPRCQAAIIPTLFAGITWGGTNVFRTTKARAEAGGATLHFLPKLHDIDTPEDLRHIGNHSDPE